MDDINNNTLTTDNSLLQLKPETSRDEQLAFIDTLREIQGTQNQEIQNATHALGTDVVPRYGGLSGTNSYWLNQYQTPQTEARIASLRSAAQSSALQTALNNYLGRLQEQYNQAYRKARKRSNSPTTTTPTSPSDNGDIEHIDTPSGTGEQTLRSIPGTTTIWDWSTDSKTGEPGYTVLDYNTNKPISSNNKNTQTVSNSAKKNLLDYAIGAGTNIVNPFLGGAYNLYQALVNGKF